MSTESLDLTVLNAAGESVGTKSVPTALFATKVKRGVLHQAVLWQRAKRRAGTHKVKTRAEASGGGRKPYAQKGTGQARRGSNTSPLMVGGGVAHGPKPHSYEVGLNKQERRLALCAALSARASEGRLLVVKDFGLSGIKTKSAAQVLKSVGVPQGKTALVVIPDGNQVLEKSLRNIEGIKVIRPLGVNVFDVLHRSFLIFVESALESVQERLS